MSSRGKHSKTINKKAALTVTNMENGIPAGQEGLQAPESEKDNSSQDAACSTFEEELCWCIEQLHTGLQKQKATRAEVERSQRLIRMLQSEKTAKVKKRQMMRTTFGDYRKKMELDLKSNRGNKVEPCLKPVDEQKLKEGVFFRKCVAKQGVPVNSSSKEQSIRSPQGFEFGFQPP